MNHPENSFALYVHVPFCIRKCPYCAFASMELDDVKMVDEYLEQVLREAKVQATGLPWRESSVHSLFLGGGTPSLLKGRQIRQLLDTLKRFFRFDPSAEITIEVNPGTLDSEKMRSWRDSGINRISLGVQSLDDRVLARLGRIHSADQARRAYQSLRESGFTNISIDLMYGIAVENSDVAWKNTLKEVNEWHPNHVSAYGLTIESDTPFAAMKSQGIQVVVDEDTELQQYSDTMQMLQSNGYEHYEVSNWALPGFDSLHNISYWNGSSYLALGPAGHSFDGVRTRFWNHRDLGKWMQLVRETGTGVQGKEILTDLQRFQEILYLGLRMVKGFSLPEMEHLAAIHKVSWPPERLEELIDKGFLVRNNNQLRYSSRGLATADEVEVLLLSGLHSLSDS